MEEFSKLPQGLIGKNPVISKEYLFAVVALMLIGYAIYLLIRLKKEKIPAPRRKISVTKLIKVFCHGFLYILPASLFPAIFLFCNNAQDVELSQGIVGALICSGIGAVWLFITLFLVKNGQKAVILTDIGLILFWNFGILQKAIRCLFPSVNYWHGAILMVGVYAAIIVAVLYSQSTKVLPVAKKVIALVYTGLLVVNIAVAIPKFMQTWKNGVLFSSEGTDMVTIQKPLNQPAKDDYPNVYLFVFDEYSSSEMIRKYYGYDNTETEEVLTDMGFQYSHGSRYNLAGTIYGLQATLNLEYPTEMTAAALAKAEEAGKAFDLYRNHGYTVVHYSANMRSVENDFNKIMFENSLAEPLCTGATYDYWYDGYTELINLLNSLDYTRKENSPCFSYIYLCIPHSPYVFDENGGRQEDRFALDYASDQPYLAQYQYANKLMIGFAERIIRDDPNAVIMLQSDHSMRWMYTYHDSTYSDYGEILNALYFKGEKPFDNNGLNGANTMRKVANFVLGTDFALLEDDYAS